MSASPDDLERRLRAALRDLAEEDLGQVLADARSAARVRATEIVEQALVDAILERAAVSPKRDREQLRGSGWWVYGIAPASAAARLPHGRGVEPGTEVEAFVVADLVALVSAVPFPDYDNERLRERLEDLEWVERTARAHEEVLEAALGVATVIPMRLCTIYSDRAGVEQMLSTDHDLLAGAIDRLTGRQEWGLKVFAHRDRLLEVARAEYGEEGDPHSDGAEYLQRKRRERELGEHADRAAGACAEHCHARLEEVAAAARTNPPQRPEAHGREAEMVLNGVYLVDEDRRESLHRVVADLRASYESSGFDIDLTGPWPAYNFVAPAAAIPS